MRSALPWVNAFCLSRAKNSPISQILICCVFRSSAPPAIALAHGRTHVLDGLRRFWTGPHPPECPAAGQQSPHCPSILDKASSSRSGFKAGGGNRSPSASDSWRFNAACELVEAGCGDDLVASVTGQSPAMVLHYTKKVRQKIRAVRAQQKRTEQKQNV